LLWYREFFGPAVTILVVAFVLLSIPQLSRQHSTQERADTGDSSVARRIKIHEVALLAGFMIVPLFLFVTYLAQRMKTPVWDRYAIVGILGLTCLLGIAAGRKAGVGIVVLFCLMAEIGADLALFRQRISIQEPSTTVAFSTSRSTFDQRYQTMREDANKDLPIVLTDNLEFASTLYYAPADVVSRLRYMGGLTNGSLYERLQICCKALGKRTSAEALASQPAWLFYGPPDTYWSLQKLAEAGATIHIEKIDFDHGLFLVTNPLRQLSSPAPANH
jgi:hypothetical protein